MLNVSLETVFKNRFKIVNLNKLEVDESKDVLEKVASLDSIFILKMAKIFDRWQRYLDSSLMLLLSLRGTRRYFL